LIVGRREKKSNLREGKQKLAKWRRGPSKALRKKSLRKLVPSEKEVEGLRGGNCAQKSYNLKGIRRI